MITDLLLIETGNGGDLVQRGNDLVSVTGMESAVYLALFGDDGNGCWLNYMLPAAQKFTSNTQKALRENSLGSQGRLNIETAVKLDLAFLNNITGTTWTVAVSISNNNVNINVNINGQTFSYSWNPDTLFLTYSVPNYL